MEDKAAENDALASSTPSNEQEPPPYWDSEPSSQPPSYIAKKSGQQSSSSQRWSGPASAASIAAILGPPPKEPEKKRTWADRWRDMMSGNNYGGKAVYRERVESGSRWNSDGVPLSAPKAGGQVTTKGSRGQ